jgi:predicted Fe-Mo cluster-binding NifX family protein
MKIALPLTEGILSTHFGHCEEFAIATIDAETKKYTMEKIAPPPHQPGVFPEWLAEKGVELVIASGMGQKAQNLFADQNIKVKIGVSSKKPEMVIEEYLSGSLKEGENSCSH